MRVAGFLLLLAGIGVMAHAAMLDPDVMLGGETGPIPLALALDRIVVLQFGEFLALCGVIIAAVGHLLDHRKGE